MKKFIAIFAVATLFAVSCNNKPATEVVDVTDSITVVIDSAQVDSLQVDSLVVL